MQATDATAKYRLYGDSAVSDPIQAPDMPSDTSTNGPRQQADARIAPNSPPATAQLRAGVTCA